MPLSPDKQEAFNNAVKTAVTGQLSKERMATLLLEMSEIVGEPVSQRDLEVALLEVSVRRNIRL